MPLFSTLGPAVLPHSAKSHHLKMLGQTASIPALNLSKDFMLRVSQSTGNETASAAPGHPNHLEGI